MKTWLRPLLGVATGLAFGLLATLVAGENPVHVLAVLARSSFASKYDFGMMLFYATPLIFTGLSVALAWHAGLFNIGAEGQLTLGALAAAAVGILCPGLPWPLAPVVALCAAMLAGGLWAGFAGWLRVRRGSHEVITTIMLNFISAGIASYVTLYTLKNVNSQNPETLPVAPAYLLHHFEGFGDAPLSSALFLALATAALAWFFLYRTVWGFELRAVGQSEAAAEASGIRGGRMRMLAMFLAGAAAGLVAAPEILGNAGRFKFEFSPGYGFTGIAVAILARGNPVGVVLGALLFGALQKGALDLDLETEHVTRELSMVLQGSVILFVAADGLWQTRARRKARKATVTA